MNEGKGGITFHHHKNDPVEKYVGRVVSLPVQHLPQGTWGSVGKEIPEERIESLKERYKDVEWQGDIEVQLNNASVMRQLKRLFEDERKLSLFSRVLFGLPTTLIYGTLGKLAHWNFYNPYSETVQLFNENEYVNMSKVTLAEIIDKEAGSIKGEAMALANSIPLVVNTILNGYSTIKTLGKLDKEEKSEAIKYLGSSSVNDAVADALQIGGISLLLGGGIQGGLVASGIALGASLGFRSVAEVVDRITSNPKVLFAKENLSDSVSVLKNTDRLEIPKGDLPAQNMLMNYAV